MLLQDQGEQARQILYAQYKAASVTSREFTGVGFFTDFAVPDDTARLGHDVSMHLGDIDGMLDANPVGFILFINNGKIDFLEGFTCGDDAWPEVFAAYTLTPFKFK